MKRVWEISLAVVVGLLAAGVILLVGRAPRGEAVKLLPPPTAPPVLVYVVGAVATPGVYSLPAGSHVWDAVQQAGGLLPGANQEVVNLAAVLRDGDKINFPLQGDPTRAVNEPTPAAAAFQTEEQPGTAATAPPPGARQVNINTASAAELESLPGIGPVLAQRVLEYRQKHGSFTNIEEILKVNGIGPATFERIKLLITIQDMP